MNRNKEKLNEVRAILNEIKYKNLYEDFLINQNHDEFESKVKEIFKVLIPDSTNDFILDSYKLDSYKNIVEKFETTFKSHIYNYIKIISLLHVELIKLPLHDIIEIIGYYEEKFSIGINIELLLHLNEYPDSEIREFSTMFVEDAFPYTAEIIGHILNNTLNNKLFLIESTIIQHNYSLDEIDHFKFINVYRECETYRLNVESTLYVLRKMNCQDHIHGRLDIHMKDGSVFKNTKRDDTVGQDVWVYIISSKHETDNIHKIATLLDVNTTVDKNNGIASRKAYFESQIPYVAQRQNKDDLLLDANSFSNYDKGLYADGTYVLLQEEEKEENISKSLKASAV